MARRYGTGIAVGALGGAIGGWFKLGWETTWPPRAPGRQPEPAVLIEHFTHAAAPEWAVTAIHFTFSTLSGALYGGLVESFPIVGIGVGVAFGIAVWVGAHEIVMPLLKLTPPTWRLPANEQGSELVGHALWGLVIGAFCRAADVPHRRIAGRSETS